MKDTKAILDIAYPEIEKCIKNNRVGFLPLYLITSFT